MHNTVKESTLLLKEILKKHSLFLPSEEVIETVDVNEILEEARPDSYPQVKQFRALELHTYFKNHLLLPFYLNAYIKRQQRNIS